MNISITGARSELGRVVARQRPRTGDRSLHVNVAGQQANTLLHDGHAWKQFRRTALAETGRALRAAKADGATLLIHASFAFINAVERGGALELPLRSCVELALECEQLVLSDAIPACVVRLGYLYGADSADLRAYRKAFGLGRPYWSGPTGARQYHLHQHDAASALLAAARPRNAGRIVYATDGRAVPFMQFMDAFAKRVGRTTPLHLPAFSRPLARLIIREEHMQQTALRMPPAVPEPQVPGWKPRYPDYRKGLDQVLAQWQEDKAVA